jgi:hypothetical protein
VPQPKRDDGDIDTDYLLKEVAKAAAVSQPGLRGKRITHVWRHKGTALLSSLAVELKKCAGTTPGHSRLRKSG